MSSCSASTADAPGAAGWSSTGCSNSPLPTSRCATKTLSPPSGPGRCRPRRPRRAGTRRAWIALQRTAPGELQARMGPVKWIPRTSFITLYGHRRCSARPVHRNPRLPEPGASPRAAVHANAQGREARPRVFHRPDQQPPHAQGVPERHPALRGVVRRTRHPPARRRAALPCRCLREGPPGRVFAAHGQAVPGHASHALRLAGDRPRPRRESGPRRARPQIRRQEGQNASADGRGGP